MHKIDEGQHVSMYNIILLVYSLTALELTGASVPFGASSAPTTSLQCIHLLPCSSVVWDIRTRTAVRVTNMLEKAESTKPIFQGLGSRVLLDIENKGSSVLYSPWASDHLYTHQNNWITISILQYRVTFWMPEIMPRLGKLSKLVCSFCIRFGLGWVLDG